MKKENVSKWVVTAATLLILTPMNKALAQNNKKSPAPATVSVEQCQRDVTNLFDLMAEKYGARLDVAARMTARESASVYEEGLANLCKKAPKETSPAIEITREQVTTGKNTAFLERMREFYSYTN